MVLQVVIECFDEVCPKTVSNFVALVNGKHEAGRYEGTTINRVVKKGWLQGGNITPQEEGGAIKSTFGGQFADETFNVKHDKMVRLPPALSRSRLSSHGLGRTQTGSQRGGRLVPYGWGTGGLTATGHSGDGEQRPTQQRLPVLHDAGCAELDGRQGGGFRVRGRWNARAAGAREGGMLRV